MGVPTYSSAVFNFIPRTALEFHRAIARDDHATVAKLLASFFMPYLDIRNCQPGYAVRFHRGHWPPRNAASVSSVASGASSAM